MMHNRKFDLCNDRKLVLQEQVVVPVDRAADGIFDRENAVRGATAFNRRENILKCRTGEHVGRLVQSQRRRLAVRAGHSLESNPHVALPVPALRIQRWIDPLTKTGPSRGEINFGQKDHGQDVNPKQECNRGRQRSVN